jgi:diacylglycerol kinase family enzyme
MSTHKPKDVVLLCNPMAGGRWRALAEVLDSEEAKSVRRIVTDEISDVREALAGAAQRAKLVCIYGGDGTIYHVVNELLRRAQPGDTMPRLALLGGGTMNVTGRMCGMGDSPGENFRAIMRAYLTDQLLWRDIPVVEVRAGQERSFGFTFGMGPLVRVLDQYENGDKGKLAAVGIGLRAIAAAVSPIKTAMAELLAQMEASVVADGVELPYHRYTAVFANTTGAINRAIEPFTDDRTRDTFHFLAYAVSSREMALLVPLLARGKLPFDRSLLTHPLSAWRLLSAAATGKAELPRDPRYVNHPAQHLRIESSEELYTLDGEVLPTGGEPIEVMMGPTLQLALRDSAP